MAPARGSARRFVAGDPGAVRTEVLRALRGLDVTLDTEGVSSLAGHRGGALGAATLHPAKVPWAVTVELTPVADARPGTLVAFAFEARWPASVPFPAPAGAAYGGAFDAAADALDAALRRVDPSAGGPPLELVGAVRGVAPPSAVTAGATAAARVGRALEGRSAPATSSDGELVLVCGARVAAFDLPTAYLMTTAGTGIALRPGALPAAMARQVGELTARLDTALAAAPPGAGSVRVEVTPTDVPVVEFLHLQARLRAALPLRTLQVCTTCRLEKVVNPDHQRLQARTRRKNLLSGSLGAVVSTHGVSPFVLVGRVMQLKDAGADPFVCPRCQGLDADECVITFCPGCGDRRTESALRTCPRCGHDFRRDVTEGVVWREVGATDAAPAVDHPPVVSDGAGWSAPAVNAYGGDGAGGGGPNRRGWWKELTARSGSTSAGGTAWAGAAPADAGWTGAAAAGAGEWPAGWYPDPHGEAAWRWWDGSAWTAHVSAGGS